MQQVVFIQKKYGFDKLFEKIVKIALYVILYLFI